MRLVFVLFSLFSPTFGLKCAISDKFHPNRSVSSLNIRNQDTEFVNEKCSFEAHFKSVIPCKIDYYKLGIQEFQNLGYSADENLESDEPEILLEHEHPNWPILLLCDTDECNKDLKFTAYLRARHDVLEKYQCMEKNVASFEKILREYSSPQNPSKVEDQETPVNRSQNDDYWSDIPATEPEETMIINYLFVVFFSVLFFLKFVNIMVIKAIRCVKACCEIRKEDKFKADLHPSMERTDMAVITQ